MADRFLVTGLPRMRSAWFATLFNALGVDTVHDYDAMFGSLEVMEGWLHQPGLKGWCDSSAACLHPEFSAREFAGMPVVIVDRDPSESCAAFTRWAQLPINMQTSKANLDLFRRLIGPDVLTVQYADLNAYATVAAVVFHCTRLYLSRATWQTFDLLKIEQHMPKARARWEEKEIRTMNSLEHA